MLSEFLIHFEAWAKLGTHLEPINRVNAISDNIIIISGPKRELCSAK